MRSAAALVVVLLLASPPLFVVAQEGPPAHLVAPIQTVVDAVPLVVNDSITEARFDGTPQRAEGIITKMRAFVAGFEAGGEWVEGSAADSYPVNDWLRYAVEVVDTVAEVPARVADVERTNARCSSWFENATASDVLTWGRDVRRAEAAVLALVQALDDLVARIPPGVDASPLASARTELVEWEATQRPQTLECVVEAEVARAIEADEVLFLRIVPARAWPLATIKLIGGRTGSPEAVHLLAPSIGLDAQVVPDDKGTFAWTHQLPLAGALGSGLVQATSGSLATTAALDVVRIPTRTSVAVPASIGPGENLTLNVEVRPVQAVPAIGVVRAEASGAQAELVNATARLEVPGLPDVGVLDGRVSYLGNALLAPSTGRYEVQVGFSATALARLDAPTDDEKVPLWVWLTLPALGLVMLAAGLAPRLRRRVAVNAAADAPAAAVPQGARLVALYAFLYGVAVRLGLARPTDTAREMARRLADPGLQAATLEFERLRYGGQVERRERSAPLAARIRTWLRQRTRLP